MIKANFYTSVTTSWPSAAGDSEFTAFLPNIPVTTTEAPDAYWLGYVSIDDLPCSYHDTRDYSDADGITFDSVMPTENFDCGYSFKAPPNGGDYNVAAEMTVCYKHASYWVDNWSLGTKERNFCFANKFDVMADGVNSVKVYARGGIYASNGDFIDTIGNSDVPVALINTDVGTFINFITNNGTILYDTSTYGIVTLHASDFEDGVAYVETSTGYFFRIFLNAYELSCNRRNSNNNSFASATPSFMIHLNDAIITGNSIKTGRFGYIDKSTHTMHWEVSFYSNLRGYASYDSIDAVTTSTPYYYNDRLLLWYMIPNVNVSVHPIVPLEEIYKHLALSIRAALQVGYLPVYGYSENTVWAPLVKDDGQFTAKLISGNLSNDSFKNKLQPWQYDLDEWEENTYTDEDRPPYSPPSPETDDRFGGEDIRGNDFINTIISAGNNFTTLYTLTQETLSDFGASMWASLADPNYWHLVGVEFSNDFSINPADMMKYFISLRYFPLDLKSYGTSVAGIYIGRATTPISPSVGVGFPMTLNRNVIQVDGGSVQVLLDNNGTDDFRMFDPNTQVSVFVPFCGSVQLAASEVYGLELSLKYTIDLQTGSLKATIYVSGSGKYAIIATLGGTCSSDIQITANNNIEFMQRIASVITGTVTQTGSMAMQGAMAGGEVGAIVGAAAGALTGGVASLAGLPPVTVHKQGTASGFAEYGGSTRAYVTIQTGIYNVPSDFNKVYGWRCNVVYNISGVTGFTVCRNVNTSGIDCTDDEAAEIKRILESGFYA